MTAYERAGRLLERLLEMEMISNAEADLAAMRWVITEVITDALLEQVEHARAQAPAIHVHTQPVVVTREITGEVTIGGVDG